MVIQKVGIKFTLCNRWAFPYHQGGIPMHNYYLLELMKDGMDIALLSSQNEQNDSYYSDKHITFNGILANLPLVYWRLVKNKILQNELRDQKAIRELKKHWRVCIVWECAIKGKTRVPLEELIDSICNWINSDCLFAELPGF